jgi:hypothetical protein
MSQITVANGWQPIFDEAIAEASGLPPEWLFEIVKAERVDGALKLSATYVSGDIPLDDHLPADKKIAHPFRSMMKIREAARAKSLQTCECCGREGRLIGAGQEARVRCARHEYVIDAEEWSRALPPTRAMFESEEEALAHFQADFGDGLDFIQKAQAEGLLDGDDDDDGTRH